MTQPPADRQAMALRIAERYQKLEGDNPILEGAQLSINDHDNGKRFVIYLGKILRYVPATAPDKGTWKIWSGRYWEPATDAEVVSLGFKIADFMDQEIKFVPDGRRELHAAGAKKAHSIAGNTAMLKAAISMQELWTNAEIFDSKAYLFNIVNGTLNLSLDAWGVHEHDPTDYLTKICPTPYDPYATSQRLDSFLDRFLPDLVERAYIMQMLSVAALIGGNPQRFLLMLLGPSTTGKSTFMSLIRETLGRDYASTGNVSIFRGNLDDKPRPDLMRAIDSRLLLSYEASDQWELHGDQLKRLTGEDPHMFRGMHSNIMREKVAAFTPIIIANDPPRVKGADDAIRRRLRVMVMDQVVPAEQDTGAQRVELVNDLQARMALLTLMINSYIDCGGQIPQEIPPRFAEKTMEVFAALDDVDAVLRGLIEEGILAHDPYASLHQCITTTDLYQMYKRRSDGNSRDHMGSKQFTMRIKSLGIEIKRSNGTRLSGYRLIAPNSIDYRGLM